MDMVLINLVCDDLHRLSQITLVQPDRFVQIDLLLGQLVVVDHHHQVVALMFRIGFAQGDLNRPFALKAFRFGEIEFVEAAFSALFERYQLLMRLSDRTVQFVPRCAEFAFQIGSGAREVILRLLQSFLLLCELRLHFLYAAVLSDGAR